MLENYDFIDDSVMAYFKRRLSQAPRDADFALDYIKTNALSRAEQEACIDAVRFKCDVLVGAARCAASRLCDARRDSAWRLSARAGLHVSMTPHSERYIDRRAIQAGFHAFFAAA